MSLPDLGTVPGFLNCESACLTMLPPLECVVGTATPLHNLLGTSDAAAGSSFDELYIIKEELGRGAFSVVYCALRKADETEVAVKVIRKCELGGGQGGASSMASERRLRDEMRALAALRHPGIITLHGTFEDEHDLLIVTEKVEGGELFDRIVASGRFSEQQARQLMAQLLAAVAHMHSQGVVHRDLKPENLLLTSSDPDDWGLKVSDLGLVKICEGSEAGEEYEGSEAAVDGVTAAMARMRATTVCGSGYYIAPEIYWRCGHGYGAPVSPPLPPPPLPPPPQPPPQPPPPSPPPGRCVVLRRRALHPAMWLATVGHRCDPQPLRPSLVARALPACDVGRHRPARQGPHLKHVDD